MSDIVSSLPAFLSDFAADLAALEHEAYEASVLMSEKEAALAEAQAARDEQLAVARAVAKALRHEFPGVGRLLTLPTSQPADPLAARAWRAAWKARAIIQKAGEEKIAEAREKGETAVKRLLAISEYYRVDADRVRPFQSLAEALAAIDAKPQKRAPKPAAKRAPKPAAKKAAKPAAKKAEKERSTRSLLREAANRWRRYGGSAVEQRNGTWSFALAGPMRVKKTVNPEDFRDVDLIIAALNAADKAAKNGEDPLVELVAALL